MTPLALSSPDPPRSALRAHLAGLARVLAVVALAAAGLTALRWHGQARVAGQPRENLAAHLRQAHGLRVDPRDVVIPDGPPSGASGSLGWRHVFFLGRTAAGAPRDVFWVTVRLTPAGVPLASRALVNLSRTPAADESALLASGPFVAFPVMAGAQVATVIVVDARGENPVRLEDRTKLRRVTNAITNWQETGHLRGYDHHSLEPRKPVPAVALAWLAPGRLQVKATTEDGAQVGELDVGASRLRSGKAWLMYQPPQKGDKPLLNWVVDTVRRHPWVGPEKIEWLEVQVYRWLDRFRKSAPKGLGAEPEGPPSADSVAIDHDLYRPRPGSLVASNWPPPPIPPILASPSPNEGKWFAPPRELIHYNPGAPPPVLETFVHPDPARKYSGVGVMIWDPRQVTLGMVGGTKEPASTTGLSGWGIIPRDEKLHRVIAAFNGGFQTMHGEWGMQAQGRLIHHPMKWAASVATLKGGALAFGTWERDDRQVPPEIESFRQNLAPLTEDGEFNPLKNQYWGLAVNTARDKIHIVRSGMCLTREGNGAYLWGEAVSLQTLAKAMVMARCVYGMQMDINKSNASLELYRMVPRSSVKATPPRQFRDGGRDSWGLVPRSPDTVFYAKSWLPGMYTVPFPRYIRQDWRDFFYLSLRPILPGPALAPVVSPALDQEGVWDVTGLPQGEEPFPPRVSTTFLRPDPAQPSAGVQIVKLDPQRIAFGRVEGATSLDGSLPVKRPLAVLAFGREPLAGLEVDGAVVVPASPRRMALLVERPARYAGPASARVGLPASTPVDRRAVLVVTGEPLAEGSVDEPAGATGRASALGATGDGQICYGVTDAGAGAGARLSRVLALAGCRQAIRLPDRPDRGPLVFGPVAGKLQVLPGDRRGTGGAVGPIVALQWAPHAYSRRLVVGVSSRPDSVQFNISRKELLRIYHDRQKRKSDGGGTPPR
jgi:hypothetical protein